MDEPIQLTCLPSGLTVVTERMDRVETVSIGAYVATGSRNESAEENGVSHFLEHMAFKGTTSRSAAEIAEEVEAVGGHINVYTAREQTAYYVKMLKEDTALGFDIIGDILTHSAFEPEELERERGVILQEIGQANDTPDDIIFDHFQSTAYPDQALGRAVLGSEDGIRNMARSVLTGYMRRNYTNSNVVVAATGKLRHEEILDLVQRHFGDLPGNPPPPHDDARYKGGEFREERISTRCMWCLGSPPSGIPIRIITRRCCCRRCWAAACRRGCSRRSGKSAGWCIRSIRSPRRSRMAGCSGSMPARARARWRN